MRRLALLTFVLALSPLLAGAEATPPASAPAPAAASAPTRSRATAAPSPEALPPIFVPQAPKAPPVRRPASRPTLRPRVLSSETAANLNAAAPKFDPSAPAAAAPSAPRPANAATPGVLQLDPYFVQEDKVIVLRESDLLTPEGKLELAKKRQPGVNIDPVTGLNDAVALEMLQEDYAAGRRQDIKALSDYLGEMNRLPPDLKRKADEARTRNNEWSNQTGTPFRERR